MNKIQSRRRRTRKTRAHIRTLGGNRLVIFRTPRHIYAQVISPTGDKVLASASTVEAKVKADIAGGEAKYSGNAEAAAIVGKHIAENAKAAGVKEVSFDRSGFKYHGRIKALADAARENGLSF